MNNDIRWKQRFQNFEKSFEVFQRRYDAYERDPNDEAYQMSLIKAFELTFELSWKTLKDYLENEGSNPKSPRITLKEAFRVEIIRQSEDWLKALKTRNDAAHVYDEKILIKVLDFIKDEFYPIVRDLYYELKKEL